MRQRIQNGIVALGILLTVVLMGCDPKTPESPEYHLISFQQRQAPYGPPYWGCRIVVANSMARIYAEQATDCEDLHIGQVVEVIGSSVDLGSHDPMKSFEITKGEER
jgi:hypothetical protein